MCLTKILSDVQEMHVGINRLRSISPTWPAFHSEVGATGVTLSTIVRKWHEYKWYRVHLVREQQFQFDSSTGEYLKERGIIEAMEQLAFNAELIHWYHIPILESKGKPMDELDTDQRHPTEIYREKLPHLPIYR